MRCTSTHPDESPFRIPRLALCLTALVLLVAPDAQARSAERALIGAFESAPAIVLGQVQHVVPLAHAGYIADIRIERVLRGDLDVARGVRSQGGEPEIAVAWEEPAPSLPPRFEKGRRVLVAIEPLPTASIWRLRVPDEERRSSLVAVPLAGDAHLMRPASLELDQLEHYLALDAQARRGDAGVTHLARMSASAQPRLALACLQELRSLGDLMEHLGDVAALALTDALMREGDARRVGEATLALIEERRPEPLRAALTLRIASYEPNVPATLHAALAALDGEIPEALALELLQSASPEQRLAAARWARGEGSRAKLRILARDDAEPAVRAAAIARLLEVEGEAALPEAMRALGDPASQVRREAMDSIADFDPEAIADLRHVVETGSETSARSAVATLSMMGVEAHRALAEIAKSHPDKGVRTLAGIALGEPLGHSH